MSRDDFIQIQSLIIFCPPSMDVSLEVKHTDPLWFSWSLITNFQRAISSDAIPLGMAAHDKNTAATKACTCVHSYLPSEPDPYGIWFYAMLGSHPGTYLHSMFDNCSENLCTLTPSEAYCQVFKDLCQIHKHLLDEHNEVDPTFASTL